jgi:hypothetical protein
MGSCFIRPPSKDGKMGRFGTSTQLGCTGSNPGASSPLPKRLGADGFAAPDLSFAYQLAKRHRSREYLGCFHYFLTRLGHEDAVY